MITDVYHYLEHFRSVVLQLVKRIEPKKCHAGMRQTLIYNQERIHKIRWGDAALN